MQHANDGFGSFSGPPWHRIHHTHRQRTSPTFTSAHDGDLYGLELPVLELLNAKLLSELN